MPESLACEYIRQVHFDERNLDGCECIAQRYAGVGKRRRIDQNEARTVRARLLHASDQLALEVTLEARQQHPGPARDVVEPAIDRLQSVRTIDPGFTGAQQI